MGKIALVFAGQGAQYPGMGKSLYEVSAAARAMFDLAERLRPGTLAQCFEGTKEELTVTRNTQPCLYGVDLAAACALREAGVAPAALAGFSLGEIAALTFSGAVSPEDGFSIVCARGEAMQAAAEQTDAAMVAVVKLDNATVEGLCARFRRVYPVNYNCPGQLVVAGAREELEAFKAAVKEAGGKALPLAVGGGFHSPFMEEAAEAFAGVLARFAIKDPALPLYANATARPYEGDYRALLVRQMKSPVRWQGTVEAMLAAGIDTFIEVGPGKTLCGLIKKTAPQAAVLQVEDADTLAAAVTACKGEGTC